MRDLHDAVTTTGPQRLLQAVLEAIGDTTINNCARQRYVDIAYAFMVHHNPAARVRTCVDFVTTTLPLRCARVASCLEAGALAELAFLLCITLSKDYDNDTAITVDGSAGGVDDGTNADEGVEDTVGAVHKRRRLSAEGATSADSVSSVAWGGRQALLGTCVPLCMKVFPLIVTVCSCR